MLLIALIVIAILGTIYIYKKVDSISAIIYGIYSGTIIICYLFALTNI